MLFLMYAMLFLMYANAILNVCNAILCVREAIFYIRSMFLIYAMLFLMYLIQFLTYVMSLLIFACCFFNIYLTCLTFCALFYPKITVGMCNAALNLSCQLFLNVGRLMICVAKVFTVALSLRR